jgi:hypothetical protein
VPAHSRSCAPQRGAVRAGHVPRTHRSGVRTPCVHHPRPPAHAVKSLQAHGPLLRAQAGRPTLPTPCTTTRAAPMPRAAAASLRRRWPRQLAWSASWNCLWSPRPRPSPLFAATSRAQSGRSSTPLFVPSAIATPPPSFLVDASPPKSRPSSMSLPVN